MCGFFDTSTRNRSRLNIYVLYASRMYRIYYIFGFFGTKTRNRPRPTHHPHREGNGGAFITFFWPPTDEDLIASH